MALMNIYSWCIVPYYSFRIWPVFCRRHTAIRVRLVLSVGRFSPRAWRSPREGGGGGRGGEGEEVKEVAAEVAEAQAKESLNYKTTNAGDRPKNVRRRRDFSPRLSLSLFFSLSTFLFYIYSRSSRPASRQAFKTSVFMEISKDTAARQRLRIGTTTDMTWYVIFG